MKKCPPGVICVENMSMLILIIFICLFFYFVRQNITVNNQPSEKIIIKDDKKMEEFNSKMTNTYTELSDDEISELTDFITKHKKDITEIKNYVKQVQN